MFWALKKGFYRGFHMVMKIAIKILPIPIPVVLTGPGSVTRLAENIKAIGIKSVLVVTDKILMDLNLLDGLLTSLEEKSIKYIFFNGVEPNPTIENVEAGKKIYSQNNCQGIIAFGGGSPIDCAKIIGARIRNPFLPVRWMKGLFKVLIPIPPFFCIPTTAGTGSEATVAAVIKNAIAHTIGGLYGVPHGLANAIILPYILEFSQKEAKEKLARLAVCGGIGNNDDSADALSRGFIEKVKNMNRNMNIPAFIKELKEQDIPLIVKGAMAEAHPDYPVPRIMKYQDCVDIVKRLLPPPL